MAVARASDARRWWPRQWAPDSGGAGSSTGSGADHGGLHLNRLQDGRTKYFVRAVTFCTRNNVIDNTVCAGQPSQAAVHTRRYLVHRISLVQDGPGSPYPRERVGLLFWVSMWRTGPRSRGTGSGAVSR